MKSKKLNVILGFLISIIAIGVIVILILLFVLPSTNNTITSFFSNVFSSSSSKPLDFKYVTFTNQNGSYKRRLLNYSVDKNMIDVYYIDSMNVTIRLNPKPTLPASFNNYDFYDIANSISENGDINLYIDPTNNYYSIPSYAFVIPDQISTQIDSKIDKEKENITTFIFETTADKLNLQSKVIDIDKDTKCTVIAEFSVSHSLFDSTNVYLSN